MISSVAGVSASSGSLSLTILSSSVANCSFPFPQTPMLLFISKTKNLLFFTGNKGMPVVCPCSLSPITYEPSQALLIGSCHGLVCFSLFDHPHDLVLLNPSTGERHTVSCPMVEKGVDERLQAYGFGYDESADDYKVVWITRSYHPEIYGVRSKVVWITSSYRAEIYSVRSGGFSRTIPLPTIARMHYGSKSIGVFVGRSIHWCEFLFNSKNPDPREHVIHAIDLVSETYHQLQFPDYHFPQTGFVDFNVGIVDTRLSLCGVHGRKIGIWVMEEYGNPESWNRLYCIEYRGWCPSSVTTVGSNADQILLMLDWNVLSWYDPSKNEDGTSLSKDACWEPANEAMYCLESLVKIFPNQTADMKRHAYEMQLKRLADMNHPDFIDCRVMRYRNR